MDDLDALLSRLAREPGPADLNAIEVPVFARLAARSAARAGARVGVMTISAALVIGIVGAAVPAGEAGAASSLVPLSPTSSLAPSVLLAGER